MFQIVTILILLFFVGTADTAVAAFRCGPKLVTIGDTKVEVLGKCGEPTFTEITSVVSEGGYRGHLPNGRTRDRVTQTIEKWTYNCGPHNFIKILVFRGGILKDVETGDYGYGESDCVGAVNRDRQSYKDPENKASFGTDPSAESDYGRISVYGFPDLAKVYVDDRYMGDMPVTLDHIGEGPHNILVRKELYKDLHKRVMVKPGETLHLKVFLEIDW
jgi:hypothetical protein